MIANVFGVDANLNEIFAFAIPCSCMVVVLLLWLIGNSWSNISREKAKDEFVIAVFFFKIAIAHFIFGALLIPVWIAYILGFCLFNIWRSIQIMNDHY